MGAATPSTAAAEWSVSSAYPAGPTVVHLRGDVNAEAAPALHTCLIGGVERGADIVIDLTRVTLIDCTCLGVLIRAHRRASALGLVIALAGPPPIVQRALSATGTDLSLPVFAEVAQATLQLRQHALEHVWPERLRRARADKSRTSRWRRLVVAASPSQD